jgi:TM2 domain-containing membrane protein YozV
MSRDSTAYKAFITVVTLVLLTFILGVIMISVLFHALASANIDNEYLTKQVQNLMRQCDCREGGKP